MATSSYSLVASSQLMENHISAAVLDGSNGFAAFQTPAAATVLLSIGSDGTFRSSVETQGSPTGWTVTDISPQLASRYSAGATIAAKAFAASSNTGQFVVLLAVSVTQPQGSVDEVWMLTGPATADASTWLAGGANITWTKLTYDAAAAVPVESITAANLKVTGLFLENGLAAGDPTLALVTVQDPAASNELRCFVLDLQPAAKPVWTYFPQEQNIGTASLSMAPGRTTWGSSWGLYKLYSLDGTASLTFMPTTGSYGPPDAVLLTVPAGASAIASLTYQPAGPTAYTDLFVAADGFIGYFPYDQARPHQAIPLITDALITGVTALHVVECDGTVVLWGLNSSGQVFYTTAALADRASPSAWQPPVALLAGTTSIAAVAGGAADTAALFAVTPLAATTATGNTSNGLVKLARNPATRAWGLAVQPQPSTTDCITLKTYTTRVLLVDGDNLPQAGKTLTASVSADCSLIVNGASTAVTVKDQLSLTTDAQGHVSFIHAVSSLATPSITIGLPDGSTATIDPKGAVSQRLSNITQSDQLLSAQYVDASGKTRNLVAPGTDPTAVQGVVNGLQAISGALPSLPTTAAFLAAPRPAPATPPESLGAGVVTDLGDLVQFVVNVAEDIAEVVFHVVDGAVHFVVTIAEDVFTAIVNTVEDAFHAITALFKWIGAELDAVFRWLGFLFDWDDFVAVKNLFKTALTQSFTSLGDMIAELQQAGDRWCAHTKAHILGQLQSLPTANVGTGTLDGSWASAQPAPAPVGGSDMRTDPRLGWLKDRASTSPNTASTAAVAPLAPELTSASDALSTFIQEFAAAMKNITADAGGLIDGSMAPATFFSDVLTQLEALGIDAVQAVFDSLCAALEALVAELETLLDMPIDIPILSALYQRATGSPLSLFDLTCLLLAIGTTICYKIATGNSPTASLSQSLSTGPVKRVFDTSLQSVLTPPQAAVATQALFVRRSSSAPSAPTPLNLSEREDAPSTLLQVTGGLLLVQAITMAVDAVGDGTENHALSNVAFLADVSGRTLRGLLEIIDDGEPMQIGGSLVKVEFGWNCLCTLGTIGNIKKEGWSSETAIVTSENDYVISLIWGIWQLVNIAKVLEQTGECPVGRSGEAVIELIEWLQCLLFKAKQPEWGAAVAVIRCASAVVAGVERLSV